MLVRNDIDVNDHERHTTSLTQIKVNEQRFYCNSTLYNKTQT